MRNDTRARYNQYVAAVALANAIAFADAAKSFVAAPTVEQVLYKKIQDTSEFLKKVNMPMVRDLAGEIIGMGISGTIAGRVNVATTDRLGSDPTALDDRSYLCKSTDFDVSIPWAKLDQWSKFPNFMALWAALVAERIALDMIMIGWNGTSASNATDRNANPLLQDVNIGWLQKQRTENAGRTLTQVGGTGKITYGHVDANYINLDALVYDMVNTLLPPWAADDTGLVAIVGRSLLHDKYFPLINKEQDAQNTLATDIIMSSKRLGGLPAVRVPHFPDGKIFVTRYDNLSIYIQEQSTRRKIDDNHKRKRVEDFNSANHAYVIEDLEFACLAENIEEFEDE